jgi:hypothetical protein
MNKKTMYVDASRVAPVVSSEMVFESSASLMANENVEYLFNDLSAVLVERVFHYAVDLVAGTVNTLPKRLCVATWRDVRVIG